MVHQGYDGSGPVVPQMPVYSIGMQPDDHSTANPSQTSPGAPGAPVTPPGYMEPSRESLPPPDFLASQPAVMMTPGPGAPHPPPVYHISAQPPPMMMPPPDHRPLGCPPGLEYLIQTDQLLVHQKVSVAEVIIGWEMNNVYTVKNSAGQQVFMATEENDLCSMQCGPGRAFTIHVQDNLGHEVLTLTRPLRCSACCFPCCLQVLEVQIPSAAGVPIGYVVQNWHPLVPSFTLLDERREPQLKIKGPFCDCRCMSDIVFELLSLDETAVVGQISKQWGGFMQEGYTDADNFGIKFPADLDVKMKALMLGACFLIDFMFFETNPNNHSRHS